MEAIKIVLRYFPVGKVAGPPLEIKKNELDKVADKYRVSVLLDEIKGKNVSSDGINIREETMNVPIEEVSQRAVTVSSGNEDAVREAVGHIVGLYSAPRTVFGTWGSNDKGKILVSEILSLDDGWR